MNSFQYKRRNLASGPHLLGMLLIAAGVFALVSPTFLTSGSSLERVIAVGVGAILLGVVIVSSYGGTLIDFSEKRRKEYYSICGYKVGEWDVLPDIVEIRVTSTSYMSRNTANGISPTLSGKITDFKVLLISNSPKPVLSFAYSKQDRAVKQAKRLAAGLKAELVLAISEKA